MQLSSNARSPSQNLGQNQAIIGPIPFLCVGPQLLGLFGVTVKGMKRQTRIFKILRDSRNKIKHNKACNVSLNLNIVLLASVFPMIMLASCT